MKLNSKTFDLFELIVTIAHSIYGLFTKAESGDSLTQQELLDSDFVAGQGGKVVLFLIQIIYYLDITKIYSFETALLILGYYFFAAFMILVEYKYIYDGYSYTFHRIISNRLMNITVNSFTLYVIHNRSSLLDTWQKIKKYQISTDEILIIVLVAFTCLEILQLLIQLGTTIFPCMKALDKTENFYSLGGGNYLCLGQFLGMAAMVGTILYIHYHKNIPFSNLLEQKTIILESFVGLEFVVSIILCCNADKSKEDPPRSKKFLCFGYGFCIGAMGIISGPAIIIILVFYAFFRLVCCCCQQLQFKCIICCWFAKIDKSLPYKFNNLNSNEP